MPRCQNVFSLELLRLSIVLKSFAPFQFLSSIKIPDSYFSLVWDEFDGKITSNSAIEYLNDSRDLVAILLQKISVAESCYSKYFYPKEKENKMPINT